MASPPEASTVAPAGDVQARRGTSLLVVLAVGLAVVLVVTVTALVIVALARGTSRADAAPTPAECLVGTWAMVDRFSVQTLDHGQTVRWQYRDSGTETVTFGTDGLVEVRFDHMALWAVRADAVLLRYWNGTLTSRYRVVEVSESVSYEAWSGSGTERLVVEALGIDETQSMTFSLEPDEFTCTDRTLRLFGADGSYSSSYRRQ
jgi:hypothetical protein